MDPNLKTIFITGGFGYIGSNLAVSISVEEANVVIIDLPGSKDLIKSQDSTNFEFGDLLNLDFIEYLSLKYSNVSSDSIMIHLAASKSVSESTAFPEKYLHGNVSSTSNVLLLMKQINVKNLIFASTAAVYGNQILSGKISELENSNPLSPYAVSKLMCEKLIEESSAEGIKFAILRLFNVVGAVRSDLVELNGSNLIPTVLRNFSEGLPIFIFGSDFPTLDGTCERDYIDVRDLNSAIKICVEILPKKHIGILNIGSGEGHTVLEVMGLLEERIGKLEVILSSAREGDPATVVSDNSKAMRLLDWEPKFDLAESVNSMVRGI